MRTSFTFLLRHLTNSDTLACTLKKDGTAREERLLVAAKNKTGLLALMAGVRSVPAVQGFIFNLFSKWFSFGGAISVSSFFAMVYDRRFYFRSFSHCNPCCGAVFNPIFTEVSCKKVHAPQSFFVGKAEIVAQDYDLSINLDKAVVHDEVEHRPPHEILDELDGIEEESIKGMKELRGMLR